MASLSSQSSNPTKLLLPAITGVADYPALRYSLDEILQSNFGITGQDILHKTSTTLTNPGPCPAYNDERRHPITGVHIAGSREYEQEDLTAAQLAIGNTFDTNLLALKPADKANLKEHVSMWKKDTATYLAQLKDHRSEDDSLLNLLKTACSPAILEVLKSNPLTPAFKKLPPDCINRSKQFLDIMDNQFSKGNSQVSVNELTKFLSLSQGAITTESTAAFLNRVDSHYQRILPILLHATTVQQLAEMLLSMVILKGVNRTYSPTQRAIEIHLQTYVGNLSLDHHNELKTSILALQDSDLHLAHQPDPISSQASALLSSPTTDILAAAAFQAKTTNVKGKQRDGRSDHCMYCLTNFKKYYYHKEAVCEFKKKGGITKLSKPTHLSANLASPSSSSTPTLITNDQIIAFLALQGIEAYEDITKAN
mmetsp:Transcript_22748/g.31181  ORF Transcript_22748/g.31181 Transcript_22748/m.31181 type:complete len:424 (+) Transcript_22748:214-1485(+)